MASDFNSVVLMGRLTRKPEVKTFESGSKMATAGLAVNRSRKDAAGDYVEEVNFFDLKIFGRQAEIAEEYLDKGRQVLVQGRLENESWEKDGKKNSKTVIVVETFQMIGSGKKADVEETAKKK